MRNPFRKKVQVRQRKSATYSIDPDSFMAQVFGNGGGWISATQAMKLYQQTSSIATSVDMISSAFKQIQPVIQSPDGKFIDNHPILTFLKKPNGFDDWITFAETIASVYLLTHDTILLASGNVKFSPAELWPSSLQTVSVMQGEDDYPARYMVSSGILRGLYTKTRVNGEFRFYDEFLKELYHIKGFMSRIMKTQSDSPLQAAAMEAKQLIQGKYHNVKLLQNGARLSLLVVFKDEDIIDDDEHQQRKKKLNEQYSGPENSGDIGVISGTDVDIKEFGKSNKDMDFAKLEKMASDTIYLRYQIPLALVTTEASTFDNLKTGIELLYDNAVLPTANVLFAGLTRMLLPRYGMDPTREKITFNPESIEPLKKRKLDELNLRTKINVETINEIRSGLPGREPLEGGDVLYIKSNMQSIATDLDTSDNNST